MILYEKTRDEENGFFMRSGDLTFPIHFHRSIEIVLTEPGADIVITVNKTKRRLTGYQIVFVDSYDVHEFAGGNDKCHSFIIPIPLIENYTKIKGKRTLSRNFIEDEPFIVKVAPLVMSLKSFTKNKLAFAGAADLLLAMLSEHIGFADKPNPRQTIACDIIDFLDSHCTEKITLMSVAEKMGYHKCYLSKIINEYLNDNFNNLLNASRYKRFTKLQQPGEDLLPSIFNSGFNSVATFYRFCGKKGLPTRPNG